MVDITKTLRFMWRGGNVRRYHTRPTLQPDFVGHHSYNVCCIIMKVRPDASVALLRAAIKHDMAEHIVGDVPAPTKRELPARPVYDEDGEWDRDQPFREVFAEYEDEVARRHGVRIDEDLTAEETWVLKFADAVDGMRFCINEALLGNRTPRLQRCYETFRGYVSKLVFAEGYDSDSREMEWPSTAEITPTLTEYAQERDVELFKTMTRRWTNAVR